MVMVKKLEHFMTQIIKGQLTIERIGKSFTFLTNYLKMRGYQVKINPGNGELLILTQRMEQEESPVIFLDGVRMQSYDFLTQLYTSDVKAVYINKSGGGIMGATGLGGVIKIRTVNSFGSENSEGTFKESTFKFIANNGFAPTKEFYAPQYRSYSNNLFEEYGDIHWIGDTFLNKNGNTSFKILNTQLPEIKIFVEGMTENGLLISEEINLKIN